MKQTPTAWQKLVLEVIEWHLQASLDIMFFPQIVPSHLFFNAEYVLCIIKLPDARLFCRFDAACCNFPYSIVQLLEVGLGEVINVRVRVLLNLASNPCRRAFYDSERSDLPLL